MLLNSQIQAFIHLDKPFYSPGEQVNGTVSIQVSVPVQATDLELKLLGGEFVYFVHPQTGKISDISEHTANTHDPNEHLGNFTENRVFYDFKNPIYKFHKPGTEVGIIKPGQYQFPFSFLLSEEAPSSFEYNWKNKGHRCNATIQYIITANVFDNNRGIKQMGGIAGNLAHKELTVVPRLSGMIRRNRRLELTENVNMCCCLNQGEVRVVAHFENDRFRIGSSAVIVLEIDNRHCSAAVNDVDIKLEQRLSFKARGQEQRKVTILKEVKGPGCPAKVALIGKNSLKVDLGIYGTRQDGADIFGSCHGELVECRHRIVIVFNMGVMCNCSKSPELHLDVPIFKPFDGEREPMPSFMTSNWNPQINSTFMFNPNSRPPNKLDISINPYTTDHNTSINFQKRNFDNWKSRNSPSRNQSTADWQNPTRPSMRGVSPDQSFYSQAPNQILNGLSPRQSVSQHPSMIQRPSTIQQPSMMQRPSTIQRRQSPSMMVRQSSPGLNNLNSTIRRNSPPQPVVRRSSPQPRVVRVIGEHRPSSGFIPYGDSNDQNPEHMPPQQHQEHPNYQPDNYEEGLGDYQPPVQRRHHQPVYENDEDTTPLFQDVDYEPNY